MYVREYGDPENPKILMLHPVNMTGEELYQKLQVHLDWDYCIIAPDQGGHGKSGPYQSVLEETVQLLRYLREKQYTRFKLLYGASMGCAIAWRLMQEKDLQFEKIWLDGPLLQRHAVVTEAAMSSMYQRQLQTYQVMPNKSPNHLIRLYGEEIGEMMKRNFMQLTPRDIRRISYACCHYNLKRIPEDVQRCMHLDWGSRDLEYRLSQPAIQTYFPHATVRLRRGYGHCSYMAKQTRYYVEEMERFISEEKCSRKYRSREKAADAAAGSYYGIPEEELFPDREDS